MPTNFIRECFNFKAADFDALISNNNIIHHATKRINYGMERKKTSKVLASHFTRAKNRDSRQKKDSLSYISPIWMVYSMMYDPHSYSPIFRRLYLLSLRKDICPLFLVCMASSIKAARHLPLTVLEISTKS